MRDPRLDRLADVLVRYSTRVKRGDLVAIQADPIGMPLVEAVTQACIRAGAHAFYYPAAESLAEILLKHGSDDQIAYANPVAQHMIETIDVRISLWAQVNTKYLSRVDPLRIARNQASRKPLLKTFMDRASTGQLRWVGTAFPTQAMAQDAEMSLSEYEEFVFNAGLLHLPDPVAEWEKIHVCQERVREFLQGKRSLRFQSPASENHDGTDLTVDVSPPATWVNCAGRENFPDGEVFAGPQGVDGHVNYTFPAVYQGREVHGVRLEFKAGRVVNASARKNEDFLFKMLDQDSGARTLGEIAIGTNYAISEFSRNTLFDEKIGGTFHAAVGAGYPESGSTNQSGLHWDMVCDLRTAGTIHADGDLILRNGRFTRPDWPGN
ncbi:MAG: aminopeptidase [Phycisphaeraceae bacterium]|nr:aminopeptidase [Phycisphaeraceae bacterium]